MTNEKPTRPLELDALVIEKYGQLNERSPKELLSIGREYLGKAQYGEAKVIFDNLNNFGEFRELADLYKEVNSTLFDSEVGPFCILRGEISMKPSQLIEKIVQKSIYCMMESSRMYAEKTLPKEDLLGIESLIDKIPFTDMQIKNIREWNHVYGKFKEFALDVFLRGN